MLQEQKRYKAAGLAVFAMAAGLLLSRVMSYFVSGWLYESSLSAIAQETLLDVIFSFFSQIIFCFLIPFLIYHKVQGLKPKEIFIDANFKKTSPIMYALAVPIGIAGFFLTIVISGVWQIILIMFGYNLPLSGSVMPETLNVGLLLLAILLTAVLPALCEEFAVRGIFLTTMRHTFLSTSLIIVMALSFGLFHQNIMQMVYTAVSGGIMAFVVIKTKSIWPAVIIHFINNFMAVLWDYGSTYEWAGGLVNTLWEKITGLGLFSLGVTAVLSLAVIVPCMYMIIKRSKKDGLEKPVLKVYKPTLRESAFLIGALVLTALSTVITFAFRF